MYENEKLLKLGPPAILFLLAQLSILGTLGPVVGFSAVSALLAVSITVLITPQGSTHPQPQHTHKSSNSSSEDNIIPYDAWPDECFACSTEIDDDMDIRGQFVVHKGDSVAQTKAVPLCEECTWTYSTLVDNSEPITEICDDRRVE